MTITHAQELAVRTVVARRVADLGDRQEILDALFAPCASDTPRQPSTPDERTKWLARCRTWLRSHGYQLTGSHIPRELQRVYEQATGDVWTLTRPPGAVRNCGTPSGHAMHRYYGEPICDACREAHRVAEAERRSGKPKPAPAEPAPCGTYAAWNRHKRQGEPVDDACVAAHRQYHSQWRARGGRRRKAAV